MKQHPLIAQDQTLEKLSGIVKRITFHSAETGWGVLKITPFNNPGEEVAVTIHQSKVFAGATMEFYGNWTVHAKFGRQFKAVKCIEQKPATSNALERYLGSGLIKGVGPQTAKKIVAHFGKDTLTVFDSEINRLMEVPGIAHAKLQMITKAWEEHKEIKDVMMFLQQYDISTLFAVKIYKTYGNDAIKIVSENPYKLAEDIYGIGFLSADKIAMSMGIEQDSDIRITAAINHVLGNAREEGHCYLTQEQIVKGVEELLQIQIEERILQLLTMMDADDKLKTRDVIHADKKSQDPVQTKAYYAHSLYYDEEYIATRVRELAAKKKKTDKKTRQRIEDWTGKYCEKHDIQLSDEQHNAVLRIAEEGISILTGGPGCGKTTTTRVLVRLLLAMKKTVFLAAPTGRAAQRMTEVIGMQAKTIHRLLEWQAEKGRFKKNQDDPLQADVLIVDESSMLDVHLAASLLRALGSNTHVLFIGDADQLPSVGAGNVFKDIIASGVVPVFHLSKIFRQAKESYIVKYAHEINHGELPKVESPFHRPDIWQSGEDCLFVDSDEATQEQVKFVRKVRILAEKQVPYQTQEKPEEEKYFVKKRQTLQEQSTSGELTNWYTEEEPIPVPEKFQHVNIDELLSADSQADELRVLLKRVHPWSSLNYGLSAVAMIQKIYKETIPKYMGSGVEVQILSPMTRGTLGTVNLNIVIQETVNPARQGVPQLKLGDRIFRVGDRVIQRRNNYDLEVFNGDIGRIVQANNEDLELIVEYTQNDQKRQVKYEKDALAELDLAYAITIHKSQGSEFQAVIIPLFTQHFSMLFRNLVYTGLTRAKQMAVFIGNRKALAMAVRNNKMMVRQTALESLLREGP